LQGYAQALKQDFSRGETGAAGKYVERIDAVARRIDLMVSDLLEFARLSRADIAVEPVVVRDAVHDAQLILQSDPAYKRAVVAVAIDENAVVKANRVTLVQALTNLLSNACKFVPQGRAVSVSIRTESPEPSAVRIRISDDGIGIPEDALARIFNVFERLHGEEEYAGTGIGLAIVKKGIERMGGQVGVETTPGHGSTFWIDLTKASTA
jgi:signal transduction histidine kinase